MSEAKTNPGRPASGRMDVVALREQWRATCIDWVNKTATGDVDKEGYERLREIVAAYNDARGGRRP